MTALISDTMLQTIRMRLKEDVGMEPDKIQPIQLEAVIRERLDELYLDHPDAYLRRLISAPADDLEWILITESVLINETLFYRCLPQIELLERIVYPNWLRAAATATGRLGGPLRVWSAGCSTGAEPFSLVMAFQEARNRTVGSGRISASGAPSAGDISVLATDISTRALETAARGLYDRRPVANAPARIIETYFTQEGSHYRVRDSIRSRVRFQEHNLLAATFPQGFDLICCRNVFIYFDVATRGRILDKFLQSLNPGGIILIGPSESLFEWPHLFSPVFCPGAMYYVRAGKDSVEPTAGGWPGSGGPAVKAAPATAPVQPRGPLPAVEGPRARYAVVRRDQETCLMLSGCLDPDEDPDVLRLLKSGIKHLIEQAGAPQDSSGRISAAGARRTLRIRFDGVTYISSDVAQVLIRAAMLADDRDIVFSIDAPEPIRRFLIRYQVLPETQKSTS